MTKPRLRLLGRAIGTTTLLIWSFASLACGPPGADKGRARLKGTVVSPWEVAIKVAAGRLRLQQPTITWFHALLERYDLRELPLEAAVACSAAALPPLHEDPFDRVIVALAQRQAVPVLTSDENITKYGVPTLW